MNGSSLAKYEQVIRYWSIIFQPSACTIAGAWTQSYSVLDCLHAYLLLTAQWLSPVVPPVWLQTRPQDKQGLKIACGINFSSYRSRTLLCNYSTWTRLSLSTAVTEGTVLAEETMTWWQAFKESSLSIGWGWWDRGWTVNNISWGYELTLLVKLPRTPGRGDNKSR